ncbi:MAG: hypothetical protein NTY33_00605 [Candidatus Moranbacteria bacterium]|nr:hypothetical protein [Candidatus Moranbacteria bacterium]
MHEESPMKEAIKKLDDIRENRKDGIEVPQDPIGESKKETTKLKELCAGDLLRAQTKAKEKGLIVSPVGAEAMKKIEEEIDNAKKEFEAEIAPPPLPDTYYTTPPSLPNGPPPMSEGHQFEPPPLPNEVEKWDPDGDFPPPLPEKIPTKEQQDAFKRGKEKVAYLQEINNESPEYWDLYAHLTEGFGEKIKWRSVDEIDADKVKKLLEVIDRNDIMLARKRWEAKEDAKSARQQELRDAIKSEFPKIDDNLSKIAMGEDNFKKFIEEQKNLPPDAIVHLYHGLNSGGYKSALEILNSPSHGIEQRSGPTVSLVPVGQFWKGVGFRYALRRDQIAFPGEDNPNAVVKMREDDGMEDSGYITTKSGSLPLDQFEAEVMRSNFADSDPDAEKALKEKLLEFSEIRNVKKDRL